MIARQSSKRFGKHMHMKATVEESIEIEWCSNRKPILPAGYYVNKARYYGFPENVVKDILRSENYEEIYNTHYRRLLDYCIERLRITQIVPKLPPAKEPPAKEQPAKEQPSEISPAKGGLRQLLKVMAEEKAPEKQVSDEKLSLTAVMNVQREQAAEGKVKCKLVLRNVPVDFVERDIYEELTDFEVTGVHVLRKAEYDGGPRIAIGTAFITLISVDEAVDCLEYMKGICWGHNVVSAEFADK
jgi:hypothetical protein